VSSDGSSSFFSARELLKEDKWFLMSLIGSVVAVALILGATIRIVYQTRLNIHPIAEVVRVEDSGSFDVKPISEITTGTVSKTVAWTGYAIRLFDLCQAKGGDFSSAFSDAFRKGAAKLAIAEGEGGWTAANAAFTPDTCSKIKRDEARSKGVYAVFDTKIPSIAEQQVKATFAPRGATGG